VRPKTQDLNVGAGTAILFRILRRTAGSFISTPRYVRNEGMPEAVYCSRPRLFSHAPTSTAVSPDLAMREANYQTRTPLLSRQRSLDSV
jgi:hypothetical protein